MGFWPWPVIQWFKGARQLGARCFGLSLLLIGCLLFSLRLGAAVGPATTGAAVGSPADRKTLADSIKEVPIGPQPTLSNGHTAAHITRTALQSNEENAEMEFGVSLKMRNFSELQSRLNRGELISPAEMAAKYLPLADDYNATADWLQKQGLTLVPNSGGLVVFARGTVAQVRDAFQVSFARVANDDGEITSAITAPSVPATLAPAIIGVNGLQPHLRKHPRLVARPDSATSFATPYYPKDIMHAYGANTLTQTGAGQTIAIVMDAFPSSTDLTTFWKDCSIAQTTANIANVTVGSGPTGTDSDGYEEVCLDTEWSSSIAPAAKVRVYGVTSLDDSPLDEAYQQIYTDATGNIAPSLHVLSLSFGGPEEAPAQTQTDDNLFAQLASAGITVFAASGDVGSSDGAEEPASDPNITGVGGTSLTLNTTTGAVTSETGWADSGGGTSGYFPAPVWQAAAALATSATQANLMSNRMVPDVAASADPNKGAFLLVNGANSTVGGTSWSTPTWAGFCALFNQLRATNNLPSLGILNPKIYPLLGTTNFRDITSGSNGNYTAGVGYDLVTGLGVPNVAALAQTLSMVITPPANAEVLAGQNVVFAIPNASSGETTFQWQRCPANSSTWSNLTDNATYSGSSTATLTVAAATVAMDGDQFQCIIGESAGGNSVTPPASLVVVSQIYVTSTLAGQADTAGTLNGNETTAEFDNPNDVVVDSTGNIFVADFNNDSVRKITANGTVSTFAGSTSGRSGDTNGNSTSARFDGVNAVAFDSGGNLYAADSGNNLIRKILPNGNVSTVAGLAETSGNTNGVGTAAEFNFPEGITVDSTGNIFVADTFNHLIRKITFSNGNYTVTTLAGQAGVAGFTDGNGTAATFNFPSAIAVDASGNLYVADTQNHAIRKVTQAGVVTTLAGGHHPALAGVVDGTGAFASFNFPSGIAVDASGNIYVADTDNNTIRKVTPAGVVSTLIGQIGVLGYANGVSTSAQLSEPYGLCVTPAGNIIIADTFDDLIREAVPVFAPQIQTAPQSQAVLLGQNATFSLVANGTASITYTWQALAVGNGTWTTLTNNATFNGTITATLTINSPTVALNGEEFQCLVSNAYGTATTTPVTLTLQQAPAFTVQPTSAIVSVGDSAMFSATATGLPAPTYQWQMLPSGASDWINLSDNDTFTGSSTSALTVTAASALSGAQFNCVATNGVSPNATSSSALLTVYPAGYTEWAAGLNLAGVSLLPAATPFGDTLPNLVRYAMNIGAVPTTGQLPALSVQIVNGVAYLRLDYNVSKNLNGLQVIVQYSYDLQTWQPLANSAIAQLANPNAQTSHYEASIAIPSSGIVVLRLAVQPQ
jgi:kumamolisin